MAFVEALVTLAIRLFPSRAESFRSKFVKWFPDALARQIERLERESKETD